MTRKVSLLIVPLFLFLVGLACSAGANQPASWEVAEIKSDLVAEGRVRFQKLPDDSSFIGSYLCERKNQGRTWEESGNWSNDVELLVSNTQVGLGFNGRCFFYSQPGYIWDTTWNGTEGRIVFVLQKEK